MHGPPVVYRNLGFSMRVGQRVYSFLDLAAPVPEAKRNPARRAASPDQATHPMPDAPR